MQWMVTDVSAAPGFCQDAWPSAEDDRSVGGMFSNRERHYRVTRFGIFSLASRVSPHTAS